MLIHHHTDKVSTFPWVDDFSAARNFALSKATANWILWLDADDRIRPEDVAVRDLARVKTNRYAMAIRDVEFLGSFCRAILDVGGKSGEELIADFSINLMRDFKLERGAELNIALPKERLQVFSSNGKGIPA